MRKALVNWLGLAGVVSLVSYTAAVVLSPAAYPGYNWMAQAVSDLSADTAPSRALWNQLAAPYGVCSVVGATCASIYVSERKVSSRLLRLGIYLFCLMRWVSEVGYGMFPLSEGGTGMMAFQDLMHVYVVTVAVVLLSIVSLGLIIAAGLRDASVKNLAIWAVVALAMMMGGAIGQAIVPPSLFGVAERLSVFAAVGYDAVLGIWLFGHVDRGVSTM